MVLHPRQTNADVMRNLVAGSPSFIMVLGQTCETSNTNLKLNILKEI